jgi:hypothetical protein
VTLLAGSLLLCTAAPALPISWAAASSGNWNTPGNWSPPQVPGAGDDVTIAVAGTYTVTLDVNATVNSLTLGGSSGTQTLSDAAFTLRMNAASAIGANGVLAVSGGTILPFSVALTCQGSVAWTGGTIFNLAVASTGVVNVSGAADKTASGATTNAGTVNWTGSGSFNVSGGSNFQNQSGANFNVQTGATLGGAGVFNNNAGGTFIRSGTAGSNTVNAAFDNSGTVSLQTATMTFANYTQFDGVTHLAGGNLATSSVAVIQGGVIDGIGTVVGELRLDMTGQINPGTSPGIINVVGPYTMFGGSYNAEIGGTTPGAQYDQINVTGPVSLGGNLNVSLLGGFVPTVGSQFVIINNDGTDAVTSTFTGLPQGATITVGGVQFQISYTGGDGNDVALTVTGSTTGAQFHTLTPCRVVDTRGAAGPYGGPALAAGANRTFVFAGQCGIPSNALAIAFNFTVTQGTGAGDLRIFPAGGQIPLVSTLNWSAGQTRANDAIISLGASGDVTVHLDQASGTVHFIADVSGYFQ